MWKWLLDRWRGIAVTVSALPAVSWVYHAIDFLGNVQFVGSWEIWSQLPAWLIWLASLVLERGWMLSPAPLALALWYGRRASLAQKAAIERRQESHGPLILAPDIGMRATLQALDSFDEFARLKVTNQGNRGRFRATASLHHVSGSWVWADSRFGRNYNLPWHGINISMHCDMMPSEEAVLNLAESINVNCDEPHFIHLLSVVEDSGGVESLLQFISLESNGRDRVEARLTVSVFRELGGAGIEVCKGTFAVEVAPSGEIRAVELGHLIIRSAVYGAGSKATDVTERLRAQVVDEKLSLLVENENLISLDPSPGVPKQLAVTYEWRGRFSEKRVAEHGLLELP